MFSGGLFVEKVHVNVSLGATHHAGGNGHNWNIE